MNSEKEFFLKTEFIPCLQRLDTGIIPAWGKMNVHQMIEHFADAVMISSGKLKLPVVNEGERLLKFRQFLMSDKPFLPETKNPLMNEEPGPVKRNTVQGSIGKLKEELIFFFDVFEKNRGLITQNPFFGKLNYEENLQLLYKHALHHLKQFGVDVVQQ